MIRGVYGFCGLFAAMLLVPTAWPPVAGNLDGRAVRHGMTWQTDCETPDDPYLHIPGPQALPDARRQVGAYIRAVEAYLYCLVREANADLDRVAQAIRQSAAEARAEILDEVEDVRDELDAAERRWR